MNKLTKALGIGALVLSLAGCGDSGPKLISGRVLESSPREVSYEMGVTDKEYQFKFYDLLVEDIKNGKVHKLVYLSEDGKVLKNKDLLNIRYEPLFEGRIPANRFIKTYVEREYHSNEIGSVEADGIVTKSGITKGE